ncbi:MAG: hypothetical protein WBV94_15205 [Blastocatellia bacterium]
MSNQIERPIFFENQILGAADLTVAVEHSRGQQARHNRYLHRWGIAFGLDIGKADNPDQTRTLTLAAGMAIDGQGREIVVSQPQQLSETTFSQLQLTAGLPAGTDLKTTWFPIFLFGRELESPPPPMAMGACESSSPSRRVEGFNVIFDKPGKARNLDDQDAAGIADGPGEGGWRILLGFVTWDDQLQAFTDYVPENDGIGRRYAGVQADEVAAQGDTLTLRTGTAAKKKSPLLVLNGRDKGLLQYGTVDSAGKLKPVFTVDAEGNITTEGKITGALTTGGVQVESGIATDGMILPLPPGITEKQVADGDAIVQTQISLRLGENAAPATLTGDLAATALETWVDDERRVHCLIRWFQIGGATPIIEDHPGVCHYIVLASVKEKSA